MREDTPSVCVRVEPPVVYKEAKQWPDACIYDQQMDQSRHDRLLREKQIII